MRSCRLLLLLALGSGCQEDMDEQSVQRALKKSPTDAITELCQLARQQHEHNHRQKADEILKLAEQEAQYVLVGDVLITLADTQYALGHEDAASKTLQEAGEGVRRAEMIQQVTQRWNSWNRNEDAVAYLRRLENQWPRQLHIQKGNNAGSVMRHWLLVAAGYHEIGQDQDAEALFIRCQELARTTSDWIAIAVARWKCGRLPEAQETILKALSRADAVQGYGRRTQALREVISVMLRYDPELAQLEMQKLVDKYQNDQSMVPLRRYLGQRLEELSATPQAR